MPTVTGKLIGPEHPDRVEVTATLVDVTGQRVVGYVASMLGEVVQRRRIRAADDGAWQTTLLPNAAIVSDAGDTLWEIVEGRAPDGTPARTYIVVPDSDGPHWLGDLRADLSDTQTGQGSIVYLPGPKGDNGAAGANGASAYDIWIADGHTGTEDDFLTWLQNGGGGGGGDSSAYTDAAIEAEVTRANAAYDPVGAATTAQTAAASDATSKVATHTAAADPHGDRAYTTTAVATHASDTTDVHGIADSALLETTTGAQAKADAAQAAATSAAATDATAKTNSAQTAAVAAAATDATAKVTAHRDATDPHGDRAYADGKLAKTSNLSDLANAGTARTNLGLGNAAVRNVGTTSGTVADGADARLTDPRTPTPHAATHGSGQSDAITVAQSQVTGLSTSLAGKTDGPASSTDNALARYDGTTGKLLQDSGVTVGDDGYVTLPGGQVNAGFAVIGDFRALGNFGFGGAAAAARPTVNGARSDGTALANLTSALATTGLITDSTTAGITTPWRLRHLPDQATADSLYTGTAPTISTAQTTTPTSGYIKYAPAGVTLSGSDVTGPFTYAGAGGFQIGASSPDTNYALPTSKYPNTYSSGQGVWSVEFGCDAQIIQLRFKYISTATMYRLSIDGRKVTDLMQSSGGTTAGSGHMLTVDFGSATPRRIRFDFYTMPFGGIYIPPTATLWSVPLQGGRFMVLGDSISDGSAQNTGAGAGTWFARAARLLGSTDAWEQGRGGTGYITAGSYATLGDRAATDVIAWAPSRLVVWAGYNDNAGNQTTISTAAASLYSAIKTGLPQCEVYVIGCWSPTGSPATSIQNTDATLRTAAAAAGFPFISPLTGGCYDASGTLVATHGAFITSANAAGYIGGDSVHPNDAGHVYLSRRITAAIRALMPA